MFDSFQAFYAFLTGAGLVLFFEVVWYLLHRLSSRMLLEKPLWVKVYWCIIGSIYVFIFHSRDISEFQLWRATHNIWFYVLAIWVILHYLILQFLPCLVVNRSHSNPDEDDYDSPWLG